MIKLGINVTVDMPDKVNDEYKHKDICQKAKDYMDVCDSDADSEYHWTYLKCLHRKLKQIKRLPEQYHALIGELESFMSKNSQYDSGEDHADIEGKDMFKYKDSID